MFWMVAFVKLWDFKFSLRPVWRWQLSRISSSFLTWQPIMGHSLPWISWQQDFYRVWLSTTRPIPNLEYQASIFVIPGDRVTQPYPQTLGTHFSRLLRHAWATLGLFLSSGQHTETCLGYSIVWSSFCRPVVFNRGYAYPRGYAKTS
jgi:hypothetical protein